MGSMYAEMKICELCKIYNLNLTRNKLTWFGLQLNNLKTDKKC